MRWKTGWCVSLLLVSGARAQTGAGQQAKLTAADGAAHDVFGVGVSISGDTILAVAPDADSAPGVDNGAAYVFVRNGMGWSQQARLAPTDSPSPTLLGDQTALGGDNAAIHARQAGDEVVYVFHRSGATWTQEQKVVPALSSPNGGYAFSLFMSGDTLVAGDFTDSEVTGSHSGAAWVFVRSAGTWNEQAKLIAPDIAFNGELGWSVAIDQDTLIAGAPGDDDMGSFSGSAYVFVRTGSTWTQQAKLTASDGATGLQFGSAVAISGDRAVVADKNINRGAAYVFVRSGTVWTQEQKLVGHSTTTPTDSFGQCVAIAGDRIVVGSRNQSSGPVGAAYLFHRIGGIWQETETLLATDADADNQLGSSVAISGSTIVVGAPTQDGSGGTNQGAAYVYQANEYITFCFGDGSLPTPCPCVAPNTVPSPSGAPNAGCANSFNPNGGKLRAWGSVAPDPLQFLVELAPSHANLVLLFKGDATIPSGIASGDGLRCVGGALVRFGGHFSGSNGVPLGSWTYPNAVQTLPVSTATLQPAGQTAYYQALYRNATPGFCNAATYNVTNGVTVAWP